MKTLLLVSTLFYFANCSFSQDILTLKIKNTSGHVMPNVEVIAFNSQANDLVKGRTDANGQVVLKLTKNGNYSLSYLENKDFETYEVKEGYSGTFSLTDTYDPKKIFAPKPKADRSGITFTTANGMSLRGKPGVLQLNILVKRTDMTLVPSTEVIAVSVKNKTKYTGRTDDKGSTTFYLPINTQYEFDVDGNEAIKTIDLPNEANLEMTQVIFYEKAVLNEITKGDTIIQRNITQTNGTNTHLLFIVKLKNYEGEPLADESVFLQSEGQKRVYQGLTDRNGECKLMLQKNANYIVNLKYEQGLHLVKAKNTTGFGMESMTRRYRGSKEIERILAEQAAEIKRLEEEEKLMQQRRIEEARIRKLQEAERAKAEAELRLVKMKTEKELVQNFYNKKFVPSFNSTPVETAAAPKNYLTTKPDGYSVEFNSSGPVGTPTVINDKMYIPAGFYSPSYYCLKAGTGQFVWGLELGESGASPAVYHNGVILVNTYSCTLYAIDAITGKLLWSKWLAGTVYSTPTADGDNVYVVYHYGGAYVLSCFDLRSGSFKWINRVDSETIACPVVDANEVHVVSQTGFYYIFDKITGKPIDVVTSVHAVSSPTISAAGIFLTANVNGKEQLVQLDRTAHTIKKTYGTEINAFDIRSSRDCQDQMNFNGSHPIVYQNKYVVLTDLEKLRVFDAQSEKMLWEQSVNVDPSQIPIVANNQIILANNKGEINSYDIQSGTVKTIKKCDGPIDAQPTFSKGLIFAATSGVLYVIKSIQNFEWNQWNKDAGHNLNIK